MMNAKLREGLVAKSDVSEANAQYQSAQANRIATHVQLVLGAGTTGANYWALSRKLGSAA